MKKILIVEDVEFNRNLLVQLLEHDYEIVAAVGHRTNVGPEPGKPVYHSPQPRCK
jgi:CheY-like chemotaxis protein